MFSYNPRSRQRLERAMRPGADTPKYKYSTYKTDDEEIETIGFRPKRMGPQAERLDPDQYSAMVGIHLKNENWQAAHDVIDYFRTIHETTGHSVAMTREEMLSLPIAELGLETRIVEKLEHHKVVFIRDLEGWSEEDLLFIRGFSRGSLEKIKNALAREQIFLKDNWAQA